MTSTQSNYKNEYNIPPGSFLYTEDTERLTQSWLVITCDTILVYYWTGYVWEILVIQVSRSQCDSLMSLLTPSQKSYSMSYKTSMKDWN